MPSKVVLSSEVYRCCFHHALSTQTEEIVGLLIGELRNDEECLEIVGFHSSRRVDKRPDRVEISPEQLVDAAKAAEDQGLQVVGWYHSHPNISIWPSHVDLATQASLQRLDKHLIGLIFSVYSTEKSTSIGQFRMTCFQSAEQTKEKVDIPIKIAQMATSSTTHVRQEICRLPDILLDEELAAYEESSQDILASYKNDLNLSLAHAHIVQHVTVPLLDHLQMQVLAKELQ